jgi:hypothetical protein
MTPPSITATASDAAATIVAVLNLRERAGGSSADSSADVDGVGVASADLSGAGTATRCGFGSGRTSTFGTSTNASLASCADANDCPSICSARSIQRRSEGATGARCSERFSSSAKYDGTFAG